MSLTDDYAHTPASAADFAEFIEPAKDSVLDLSRCDAGVHDNRVKPWSPSWDEFCEDLGKAGVGSKDGAYYLRGRCDPDIRENANMAGAILLIIDGDKSFSKETGEVVPKCVPPEEAHEALRQLGLPHVLHTSHSHDPANGINKWRAALRCPIKNSAELHAMSNWIIDQLNERGVPIVWVKEMGAMAQPWYLPRIRSADAPFKVYSYDLEEGEENPLTEAFVASVTKEWAAKNTSISASSERGSERNENTIIGRFQALNDNAEFIVSLLEEYGGCDVVGTDVVNKKLAYRLLPPGSVSGAAGVHVYRGKGDGTWLLYSHNDSFPLPEGKSKALDAFGVYQWLVHDNDQKAAIAAAKRMVAKASGEPDDEEAEALIDAAMEIESERERVKELKEVARKINDSPLIDKSDTGKFVKRIAKLAEISVTDLRDDLKSAPKPALAGSPDYMLADGGAIICNAFNTSLAIKTLSAGMHIAYDEFRDEILFHDGSGEWKAFRDNNYHQIRISLDVLGFERTTIELVRAAVEDVAIENSFDWAIDWLTKTVPKWDGVPRVSKFYANYLGCKDDDWATALSEYTWTAMAGRVLVPGIKADMMPVWISDEGLLKSSAIAALVPDECFFSEMSFHENDVERTRKMRGCLVAELCELAGMTAKEVEQVKAWISRRFEEWTPKFKEFAARMARRLIFIGTTNRMEFLVSDTGNRRILPIVIAGCDKAGVERDRLQLWAEAREMFNEKGVMWQSAQALANDRHEEHMVREPWADKLAEWLDSPYRVTESGFEADLTIPKKMEELPKNRDRDFLPNLDLYSALGVESGQQSTGTDRKLVSAMRQLGWVKKRLGRDHNRVSGFVRKENSNVPT